MEGLVSVEERTAALTHESQLYRSLVEAMPICVFRKDRDGKITYGNSRVWTALGYAEADALGKTDYDIAPRALADKYRRDDLYVMETGETIDIVEDHQPRTGERQVIRVIKSPVRDEANQIVGVQVMFWDITDGRRQSDKLRDNERMLAKAQQMTHVGSWRWDPVTDHLEWSEEMYRIFGVDPDRFQGTLTSILATAIHPDDRAAVDLATKRAQEGVSTPLEYRVRHPNGEERIVWTEGEIVFDAREKRNVLVGVVQDITERKRAEDLLRQQNAYLDALHDTTVSLVGRLQLNDLLEAITLRAATLMDTTHGYIYIHEPGAEEMEMSVGLGIFSQMVGTHAHRGAGVTGLVWETGHEVVIDDYQAWDKRLTKSGHGQLCAVVGLPLKSGDKVVGVFGLAHTDTRRRFDATQVAILTRFAQLASVALDNARLYADAGQEITDRKRAEQELTHQKELLQTMFDNIPVMIAVFDARGHYSMVNREWEHCLGYALEDMNKAETAAQMYPDPEQRRAANRVMFTPARGWRDFQVVGRDGRKIDTLWAYTPLSDGRTIAFGQDITERKQVDYLKNEFISTVSHELRTPLTSIRGSLGLLAGGVAGPMPERAQKMVEIASKNTERLLRLINDILDIEKIESGKVVFQFRPVEVVPLLEQAIEANRAYGEQYQVTFDLQRASDDLLIYADADRFTQVVTNLLSNAVKFSPSESVVEITASRVPEGVQIAVRDHGDGIPDEFHDRIYEKFAQADASDTRRKGGTGLGLAIVKAIVEKHGGTIAFETKRGQGTTFYVQLPEYDAARTSTQVEDAPAPRVLILEDDRDVALLLSMMLKEAGFESDMAHDAARAKAWLDTRHYDALTLDLLLPDRDGISLIRELRADAGTRDLPIIVVSARAEEGRQQLNGDAVWVADWLQKPIDPQELANAVAFAARRFRGAAARRNGKPHILHVEDDVDTLRQVQSTLGQIAEVTAAHNLAEARALLEQEAFDLAILDLSLPDGSGPDLLPLLKGQNAQIPVVIFSVREENGLLLKQVNATLVKSKTTNAQLLRAITDLIPAR